MTRMTGARGLVPGSPPDRRYQLSTSRSIMSP